MQNSLYRFDWILLFLVSFAAAGYAQEARQVRLPAACRRARGPRKRDHGRNVGHAATGERAGCRSRW
jgi:hypothetical protein